MATEPAPETPAPRPRLFARLFGWERRRPEPGTEQPVWVAGAPPDGRSPWSSSPSSSNPSSPMSRRHSPMSSAVAAEAAPAPDPDAPLTPAGAQAALEGALEALGSAHHRPFSRG